MKNITACQSGLWLRLARHLKGFESTNLLCKVKMDPKFSFLWCGKTLFYSEVYYSGGVPYLFTVVCKSFANVEGWAQFPFSRAPEPSSGFCEISPTHLIGNYKISCLGFDGEGGPISYAMNIDGALLFCSLKLVFMF